MAVIAAHVHNKLSPDRRPAGADVEMPIDAQWSQVVCRYLRRCKDTFAHSTDFFMTLDASRVNHRKTFFGTGHNPENMVGIAPPQACRGNRPRNCWKQILV